MERSSPISRLKSVDLPTLGRPTRATRGIGSRHLGVGVARRASGPIGAMTATTSSSRSPVPGRAGRSPARVRRARARRTPRRPPPVARRRPCWPRAARVPRSVGRLRRGEVLVGDPDRHVDHEEDEVGVRTARSACWLTFSSRRRRPSRASRRCRRGRRRRPVHSAGSTLRSRVTPASSSTTASAATDDPVHEGGLADVGPPGDRPPGDGVAARSADDALMRRPRRAPGRPRRPAGTAVGRDHLDRHGAGRPASSPSRKRPSDRQASGSR